MINEITILLAEDTKEHAAILRREFAIFGHAVNFIEFDDMASLGDFLFSSDKAKQHKNKTYVLLLKLAPTSDEIAMLTKIEADERWQQMPIIAFGPADHDDTVKLCHDLGCSVYLNDPETTEQYAEVAKAIAKFLYIVRLPKIKH